MNTQATHSDKSILIPESISTRTNGKTKYLFGTMGLVALFIFTPISIILGSTQLLYVLHWLPEYLPFYFWFIIFFPIVWALFICWLVSFFLVIIIKDQKVILIGIGRLHILTPMNVKYFEKMPTHYMGPNKNVEPDLLLKSVVLVNGKKIPVYRISFTLERQKRIENALIETIGAPLQ